MRKSINNNVLEAADEVRIVADGDVLTFALKWSEKIRATHYYLSPCEIDSQSNITTPSAKSACSTRTPDAQVHWQLSVQTRKSAGIEYQSGARTP